MPSPKKAPSKVVAVNSENAVGDRQAAQASPSPASISVITRSAEIEDRIRRRAYDFYEQRGRADGFAHEDWLRAEAEILSQRRSA